MMTNEEEKLVIDNINLANDIAWKYSRKFYKHIPFEEIQSLAYLGLTKAAITFKKDSYNTFSTYAYKVMHNEILMFYNSEKRHFNNISLSCKIDDNLVLEDMLASKSDMIEDSILKFDILMLRAQIDKLDDRFKSIMYYRLQGLTMDEIAELIGISQPQVSRDYQKALNILRDNLIDKEEDL